MTHHFALLYALYHPWRRGERLVASVRFLSAFYKSNRSNLPVPSNNHSVHSEPVLNGLAGLEAAQQAITNESNPKPDQGNPADLFNCAFPIMLVKKTVSAAMSLQNDRNWITTSVLASDMYYFSTGIKQNTVA
jgi:hypothetical protein